MSKEKFEIDAIKMKRKIQEKIYKETKDLTFEEFKDYIRKNVDSSKESISPVIPPVPNITYMLCHTTTRGAQLTK